MSRHVSRRRFWLAAAGLVFLYGCEAPQQRDRVEAEQRWSMARARVKARLAADQFASGHLEDAARELAEALRLAPEATIWLPLQARIYLAQGHTKDAEAVLASVPADAPERAEADYLLGVIRQQQGRWQDALQAYETAARGDASQQEYQLAAAQAHLQSGRPAEALEILGQAEQRFGVDPAILATRAESLENMGEFSAAATAWRSVLASGEAPAGLQTRLAFALYRAGAWAEAIPALETSLEQQDAASAPAEAEEMLRLTLARCCLFTGRFAAARQEAQTILQRSPEHVRALRLLACSLVGLGDAAGALRVAQRALAADADDPLSIELAAALAARNSDSVLAQRLAERLLTRDATHPIARYILDRADAAAASSTNPD